jgi:soluble lytic murein transglycosylase-like protein
MVNEPYRDFSVGELLPRRQTLSWFTPSGQVVIPITNKGDCEARVRLDGTDGEGKCSFEFQVPGETVSLARQVELRVPPGETVFVPVRITPLSRRLVSLGKQAHFCTITATALDGRSSQRTVLAELQSAPLIGLGLVALIAVGLVILVGLLLQQAASRATTEVKTAQGDEAQYAVRKIMATPIALKDNAARRANRDKITYEEMFKEIAQQYSLDWQLLAHLAYRESRLNPLAIGEASEMGLMQILPATWNTWAAEAGVTDPFDPYSNTLVAAAYLAYLKEYCGSKGHPEDYWMLVAYNWGPDNLRQLFENGGGWEQVPAGKRQYALDILQAMGVDLTASFQTNGKALVNPRKGDD